MSQDSHDPGWSSLQLASLRSGLVECFSISEIASLCQDLGVDPETIPGDGKEERARELIAFMNRRGTLQGLLEYCTALRQNYPWLATHALAEPVSAPELPASSAVWQLRKQREAASIHSLRAERIGSYKELWALLEPLAKYARPKPFTREVAQKLSEDLRTWYFHTGGIYLSENSRKPYFALQDALHQIANTRDTAQPTAALPDKDFERVRRQGSDLRAALAEDLGTRT
jgi:hypothetical protein